MSRFIGWVVRSATCSRRAVSGPSVCPVRAASLSPLITPARLASSPWKAATATSHASAVLTVWLVVEGVGAGVAVVGTGWGAVVGWAGLGVAAVDGVGLAKGSDPA